MRLAPPPGQLGTLVSGLDVLLGLLLASTFNMFFFVSGAAAFLTMTHLRQEAAANCLWPLVFYKFVRYVTLAAAGCVAVLPVAVIMIWYKDWSLASVPMNDYLNVVWKKAAGGADLHFVFPLLFFMWCVYLPLFCTVQSLHRSHELARGLTPNQGLLESHQALQEMSLASVMFMIFFTVGTPVVTLCLWFGVLWGSSLFLLGCIVGGLLFWGHRCRRTPDPEEDEWVLNILLHLVLFIKRAGGHQNSLQFFLASSAVPLFLLTWSSFYFDSVSANTGVLLIYGSPFLMASLHPPDKISLSRKFSLNTATACLLAIVFGQILFISSHFVVHPNIMPMGTVLFDMIQLDLNKDYGTYGFAFISSSAFYIFGFMYIFFENEGKLPQKGFFHAKQNRLSVVAICFASAIIIFALQFPGLKIKWILMSPSVITYSVRFERVCFALGNWYILWFSLQLWKYFSGEVCEKTTPAIFVSPRFLSLVFLFHTFWAFFLASLLRVFLKLPWIINLYVLNIGTVVLSFCSSYLLDIYLPGWKL